MSRSDRKRNSKWDLTEETRVPHENIEGSGPRRSGVEDNDMKSKHDLGYGSREPLPGSRGSHKYDSIQEGRGRHLKATGTWERDENYNVRMSPGIDEWRQRSRSPKNNWSRPIRSRSKSRSRSPIRGYRRESGNFERDRSRSGVAGQLCKDFASGRCRRGNHCPFIHQINENYDDSGESKHWKDGVSKYSSPREARDYSTRAGRSPSPREVRDYPTRGGRPLSPRGARDYAPRGGRSPSPRGPRDYPTRGCRSPSPRGARDYSTRGGRSPSPRVARDYPTRGDRSPSPRGARDYPTRGDRSTSPREAMDYPARSGRSSEICNNFLKGKCFRGASCRYVHDGASDGFDKGSATEVLRERDNDRYSRDASFDRGVERQAYRSGGDVPCRFFAAGNCRNGRHCRFSHNGQAHASPDRRPRDDRHRGPDDENQLWDGPKWSDSNAVSDAAMLNEVKHDQMDQVWDGPKWSDTNTASDAAKLSEDKIVKMGVHEPSATAWSNNDGWGPSLVNENKVASDPAESYKKEATAAQYNEQGTGDMEMSPDWNYTVPSANHLRKEEHDYAVHSSRPLALNIPSLSTHEQNLTQPAPVPNLAAAASMLPISSEKSYFHHNPKLMGGGPTLLSCEGKEGFDNSGIDLNCATTMLPGQSFEQNGRGSNVNAVSQSLFNDHQRGLSSIHSQDPELYGEGKLVQKPDIANTNASQGNPVNPPSVVTSEQLSQLTNISASLAKLLENGQELPKLYAALNPHNLLGVPSVANPEGQFQPVSAASIQPIAATASQRQYDPMYDSMDLEKPGINITTPGFSANPIKQNTSANFVDGKPTIPPNVGGPSGGSSREEYNNESQPSKQPDTDATCGVIAQDNGGGVDKSKKVPGDTKTHESGPLENAEKDGGADEGKKSKDGKGVRAFKFALVELVKELLKPSWKDGKIEKENYKTIVKKVVDKVTGTIQAGNIPQTQEKIEQYLSFSKPKVTKLTQAYVDKFQKGKD